VDRLKKPKIRKELSEEKLKKVPGSGNLWKNQITTPKAFNLSTKMSARQYSKQV